DAASDRLLDFLPEVLADLRKCRRRDDGRLRGLVDQLTDLLEDTRLRDDRVHELGFALRPEDLVEQVELAERVVQVLDDAPLHLARSFRLEDRRTAAGGDREAFLAQALKDLVRGRPRDAGRLRDRLRAPVPMGHEGDVAAGLIPGEADGLEGLRGSLELLVQIDSLGEELGQVLRNHGATIPEGGILSFRNGGERTFIPAGGYLRTRWDLRAPRCSHSSSSFSCSGASFLRRSGKAPQAISSSRRTTNSSAPRTCTWRCIRSTFATRSRTPRRVSTGARMDWQARMPTRRHRSRSDSYSRRTSRRRRGGSRWRQALWSTRCTKASPTARSSHPP